MMEAAITPIETDEPRLIERAASLDGNAFGRLYDMYVDRLYRHIYYRVANVTDAEELTKQTFLEAWAQIDRYRKTHGPFVVWLMTISHKLVIDHYRTRTRGSHLEAETSVDRAPWTQEQVSEGDLPQERMRLAILRLPKDQQHVVLLRFVEGFRDQEIASILGKSEGSIRVLLHRGLMDLRSNLEKEKDNEERI